jgi:hypothetical protein
LPGEFPIFVASTERPVRDGPMAGRRRSTATSGDQRRPLVANRWFRMPGTIADPTFFGISTA